jgi:Tol biopolymer transport system component
LQFTYSRRTSTLAYSVVPNDPNIWRLDFSTPPRWQRVVASSGQDASPQFSPNGHRIAFRSDRSGSEQIWVCDADGSNPILVTRGTGRPSVPRWAPDSRTLVFNDASSQTLYLATDLSSTWSVRSFGHRGVHPVFSPDGRSIYAVGSGAITRFPLPTGPPEVISHTRALSLGISPDGAFLYFVREPADTTMSRLQLSSGRIERVLEGLVPYCTSCWALSPDGIYYLGARPNTSSLQSLYYLDLRTSATRLLADYPEPILPIGIGPFSLSPDFKSLLTVRLDSPNSDILRIDNFR